MNLFFKNLIYYVKRSFNKHQKMLYLYTLLMLAWDLDEDTHQYFRQYLEMFISLRKVSKDIRYIANQVKFIPDVKEQREKEGVWMRYLLHNYSQVTVGGGNVLRLPQERFSPYIKSVNDFHIPIDEIHPDKYFYVAGLICESGFKYDENLEHKWHKMWFPEFPFLDFLDIYGKHSWFGGKYLREDNYIRILMDLEENYHKCE